MQTQIIFRVIYDNRENYKVIDENENLFPAEIAGRIRNNNSLWPVVGDWVYGTLQPGNWIQITEALERKSVLSRRDPSGNRDQILAANVDVIFIITSANQDLNLNRLDRYVALAKVGNMQPVLIINKIELSKNPTGILDEVAARFSSVDIFAVSVHEKINLDCFENYFHKGQTVAFIGSSGVGKSSLINYLLGSESIITQDIRESDSRGRHTTTSRELHMTSSGVAIIDTPGIRLVGLTDDVDLGDSFSDIEILSQHCRFKDCEHNTEPGCAVKGALDSGELRNEKWESYLKLNRELAYLQRKNDKALQSQEKKRWASISKQLKAKYKMK